MARKEEIEQAAKQSIKGDSFEDGCIGKGYFTIGAEWADQHPREANIATYLGKKGWPFSTYGIPTFEEASKTLDEYYEYKKKQWFDKAVGWLESNTMKELCLDLGETQSIREFIDNFKEAIKE